MEAGKKILFLEDDLRLAQSFAKDFESWGFEPVIARCRNELSQPCIFDYAVIDIRLSNGDFGIEALSFLKQLNPHITMVILSGYGSITTAVEATRRGAKAYLIKPVSSERLKMALFDEGNDQYPFTDLRPLTVDEMEKEYIDFVLIRNQGNISKTAKELGLHRQSLQRKLKKLRSKV